MRIDEFRLIRYGQPISDLGKISPSNFSLIFGPNEKGKSLTIDALVKLMLADSSNFNHIDRVDESPEGYVVIRDNAGKQYSLPQKGNLTKLTGLSPSECSNIFIIRNSNLSIESEDGGFYVSVADKLVGLRTKKIESLQSTLRNLGKITPANAFKDGKDEKLKTRMDMADRLIPTLDDLTDKAKKENLEKLEIESVNLADKEEATKAKLDLLEDARKRELYEKGSLALNKIAVYLSSADKVAIFDKEDKDAWRDSERDLGNLESELKTKKEELGTAKQGLSQKSNEVDTAQQANNDLQIKKTNIDNEVKPALTNYAKERQNAIRQTGNKKVVSLLAPLSAVIMVCGLLGIIVTNGLFLYAVTGIAGFAAVAAFVFWVKIDSNASKLLVTFDNIRVKAAQYGVEGDSDSSLYNGISSFEEDLKKKAEDLQKLKTEKETFRQKIGDLDVAIGKLDEKKQKLGSKISAIKEKSGTKTIEEYSNLLTQKLGLDSNIAQEEAALASLFGTKGFNRQDRTKNWNQQVNDLSDFKEKAKDTNYDENAVTLTKKELEEIRQRQTEISGKLNAFKKDFPTIEQQANNIISQEEPLFCRYSTDLPAIKKALESFVSKNNGNRENAIEAISIFEQIGNDQKNKVTDLFGKSSRISTLFNTVTNGRYAAVNYNPVSDQITVETKDGDTLTVDKLSSGTHDQLYLCIRVALGEKLLKGEKAFFIMDDPFIKADSERLAKQLKILDDLSKTGWQVIYFSAKDEVKDALEKQINEGSISLIELSKR